jgi:hypothetical protein
MITAGSLSFINCEKCLDLLGSYATANICKRILIRFYCVKEFETMHFSNGGGNFSNYVKKNN